MAERVLDMLRSLADITDGFATDQLTHCLQTATLAERAGADDEVVVASLCHDIGKAVSVPEPPRDRGRDPQALRAPRGARDDPASTRTSRAATTTHHFGGDPDAREKHRDELTSEEWALAEQFADEWDQKAFDPDYDTLPLEHFEPKVRQVFAAAQIVPTASAGQRYAQHD